MADKDRDPGWTGPFGDVLKRMQDLGSQLSKAASTIADEVAQSPAAVMAEPMVRLGGQMAELSTLWVGPVRAMLEEQQELIDAIADWSASQRDLAERFNAIAERHRDLTQQVSTLLEPALTRTEELGTLMKGSAESFRKKS